MGFKRVIKHRKNIKLFGCQRSGTNYIQYLLGRNYYVKVHVNYPCWKHGFYDMKNQEMDVVVSVKHPLSFAWSFHKLPKYRRLRFDSERLKEYVTHWNIMNNHWLSIKLKEHSLKVVKYEELLTKPEQACDDIANSLNLTRTSTKFINTTKYMNASGRPSKDKFDIDFYHNKQYLREYDKNMLDIAIKQVDHCLLHKLGYEMCFG